jgi:cysteinyl-tRNA synthetase
VAGARVEVAPYKRDPMDFVLWKPSSDNEPGWDSPWGRGRPGWHIECSAMAEKWLWTEAESGLSEAGRAKPHQFDIHGGGIDLIFPHHENEVAQSRCAHGTPVMANYWLHNGFLQVEGQKMSKSLGNFITIHDLLTDWDGEKWSGLVVRLAILMTQYRQPIDFTKARLEEAAATLSNWFDHIMVGILSPEKCVPKLVREVDVSEFMDDPACVPSDRLLDALKDDLNIPAAITELHRLAGSDEPVDRKKLCGSLQLLGFLDDTRIGRFIPVQSSDSRRMATQAADVERLIAERAQARTDKDWAKADKIRDQLDTMGIELHDAKDPNSGELVTTWELKR